jgi:DNA-binding NarL/FixJ family response regulator
MTEPDLGAAAPVVVSIIEDHPMFRAALVKVLEGAPELTVGVVAGSLKEFLAAGRPPKGVVLLDYTMPGVSGVEAVQQLSGVGHRVLMLTASEKPSQVLSTLDAGACGYLSKVADAAQVVWAILRVADGSFYVAPHLAAKLLEERRRARPPEAMHSLTSRESEVLTLVAEGHTDQEVAKKLHIGVRTVRSHLDHIRTKTGRRRRADLTRLALEEGLMDKPED